MSAEGRGEDAQKEDASTGKLRECDVDKEDNNVKHFETHADVICMYHGPLRDTVVSLSGGILHQSFPFQSCKFLRQSENNMFSPL